MSAETFWFSPTGFVTSDPNLQIRYPSVRNPAVEITATGTSDRKWVDMGLQFPARTLIKAVRICYELTDRRSFISQVRLTEMKTPERAIVRHDDGTDLQRVEPTCYVSELREPYLIDGAISLALRLNFNNTTDKIILGSVGADVETCGRQEANVKCFGALGDGSNDDATAILEAVEYTTTEGGSVYFPPGTYLIGSHIDISTPIEFAPDAKLKPASGVTITLQKHIQTGLYQIFDLSERGIITLSKLAASVSKPEHFGAINEGRYDDSDAFQAWASNMTEAGARVLRVSEGAVYRFETTVKINLKAHSRIEFGGAKFTTQNDIVLFDINPEADPSRARKTVIRNVVADLGSLRCTFPSPEVATAVRCLNFRGLSLKCHGVGFFRGVEFAGGDTYHFSCHFFNTRTHFFSPDWGHQIEGNVTVTNGSNMVTGAGTVFTSLPELFNPIRKEKWELRFGEDERHYNVHSIENDNHLTLTESYTGSGGAGLHVHAGPLPGTNTLSIKFNTNHAAAGMTFDSFLDMQGRWANLTIDGGSMNGSPALAGVRLSNAAGTCTGFLLENFHTEQGGNATLFHFRDVANRGRPFIGIVIIGGSFGDGPSHVFKMERCHFVDFIGAGFAQTEGGGGIPIELDANCKNINISPSSRIRNKGIVYACNVEDIDFGAKFRPEILQRI